MNKDILLQIEDIGQYVRDNHFDGFTQFEAKKKLYKILWETQKQLNLCPNFVGETEWINESGK